MKKTLVIALFMALAPWASAATDFTTTNNVSTTVSNAYYCGFALNLNPDVEASRLSTSSSDGTLSITDYDTVVLNSVAINIRTLDGASSLKLALIRRYPESEGSTTYCGDVLAVSDNTISATGDQTWTFTDVTVSTTDTLYFVWVSADNTNIEAGYTLQTGSGGDLLRVGASTLVSYANTSGAQGYDSLTMLGTNTAYTLDLNNQSYAPKLSVSTSAPYAIWTSLDGSLNVDEGDNLLFDGRGSGTATISESGAKVGWLKVEATEDGAEYTLTGGDLEITDYLEVDHGHLTVANHTTVSGTTVGTMVYPDDGSLTVEQGGVLETTSLMQVSFGQGDAAPLELAGELILTGTADNSQNYSTVSSISGVTSSSGTTTYGKLTIQDSSHTLVVQSSVELASLGGEGHLNAANQQVTLHGVSNSAASLTAGSLTLVSSGNVLGEVVTDSITLGREALNASSTILTASSVSSGGGIEIMSYALLTDTASGPITLRMNSSDIDEGLADALAGKSRTVISGSLTSQMALDEELVDTFAAYGVAVAGIQTGSSYVLTFSKDDVPYVSPWEQLAAQGGNAPAGVVQLKAVSDALDAGIITPATRPDTVAALGALEDALDAGNISSAAKISAAVAGASVATLGAAYTADVERQLRAIRNRTTTMGLAPCEVHEDLPYYNAWINAEGDYRKLDEDGTLSGYKLSSWGGTVGFDADVSPSTVLGLALTAMYGDLETTSSDRAKGDLDRYYLSAFARVTHRAWVHTFVVTGSKADITLDRTVSLGSGYDYKTHGTTDGYGVGFLYELAYTIPGNEDATVCWQPLVNVSYRYTSVDGYRESGSDAGLTVDKQDYSVLTFGAGLRMQAAVGENVYNRSSLFELRALVKVDAGDREGSADVSLLPGVKSRVKTTEVSAVGAELGAGLTIPVGADEGSLFFDVSAELRSEYSSVNGTVGYRVNF